MSGRRAAILFGRLPPRARSDERDVLVEAATVEQALGELGWRTASLAVGLDLDRARRRLSRLRPRLVFNLVESLEGRDRLVHLAPALLDSLGLPYTGSPTEAIFLTSGKPLAKRWLRAAGVPTPAWVEPPQGPGPDFPPPYIVKSVWEHASIGLSGSAVAQDRAALEQELARRAAGGSPLFVEAFVDGREFNLALLEGPDRQPQVLPPAEILFQALPRGKPRIVDYAAKWEEGSAEFTGTPRSFEFPPEDQPLLEALRELALRCWRLFGLRGYARVDFRVDPQGRPWVLEVNTNPCLSPDAGFQAAARRGGLSPAQVIQRIVEGALS